MANINEIIKAAQSLGIKLANAELGTEFCQCGPLGPTRQMQCRPAMAIDGALAFANGGEASLPAAGESPAFASFLLRLRTLGPLDPLSAGAALVTLTPG